AMRIGATVIPINPLYTPHEMTYILRNGDVKGIITMDVLIEKMAAIDDQLPNVTHYISCETGSEINENNLTPKMKSFSKLIEQGSLEYRGPSLHEEDV